MLVPGGKCLLQKTADPLPLVNLHHRNAQCAEVDTAAFQVQEEAQDLETRAAALESGRAKLEEDTLEMQQSKKDIDQGKPHLSIYQDASPLVCQSGCQSNDRDS